MSLEKMWHFLLPIMYRKFHIKHSVYRVANKIISRDLGPTSDSTSSEHIQSEELALSLGNVGSDSDRYAL